MSEINTYNQCIDIIEDKKKLNHAQLLLKWENFKIKFPQLYEMLTLSNSIDLKLLKFLCDTSEKQLLLSKQEQIENDFIVGEKLAKKYIYDKFDEPNDKQKEFIKETIRKKINNNQEFSTSSNQ